MNKKLLKKCGYIGMETLITAGLMIALGAYAWSTFIPEGKKIVYKADNLVLKPLEITIKN